MKILKIAGVSVLALGVVLGMVFPALATPDSVSPQASDIPPKVLTGKVIGIEDNTFIIDSRGDEYTISVDDDTKYFKVPARREVTTAAKNQLGLKQQIRGGLKPDITANDDMPDFEASTPRRVINAAKNRLELGQDQIKLRPMLQKAPGLARQRVEMKQAQQKPEPMRQLPRFGEEATFDDIAVGARVVVRAVPEEDNLVAKLVLIIKPTTYEPIIGTVIGISLEDEIITIAPADGGEDILLKYNEKTRFILRGTPSLEGQTARVVYVNKGDEKVAKVVLAPIRAPELAD